MLKVSTGNMYKFITHLYNPVRGRCGYDCAYCYVKKIHRRFNVEQKPIHLVDAELKANLGKENFIFVCSGCDLFHPDVPWHWIADMVSYVRDNYPDNDYLWHTKNPARAIEIPIWQYPIKSTLCVTIESNIHMPYVSAAPPPMERVSALRQWMGDRMITIEPVMDFEPSEFADMIIGCNTVQVNIWADSGHNNLPEPDNNKLVSLIKLLEGHTKVHFKSNLKRLMPDYKFDFLENK